MTTEEAERRIMHLTSAMMDANEDISKLKYTVFKLELLTQSLMTRLQAIEQAS